MRKTLVAALLGIAVLFGGSVLLLSALDDQPAEQTQRSTPAPAPEPAPPPAPEKPAPTPRVIEPPPPSVPALPVPIEPELPPAPPRPPYAINDAVEALRAMVVERCGGLEVRDVADLRGRSEKLSGQAVLLLDVEPQQDQLYVWSATTQVAGATRPALVACAQWAVRSKALPARGVRPGDRFKVQLAVSVKGR